MGGGIIYMLTRARFEKSNYMAHDQDKMTTKVKARRIPHPLAFQCQGYLLFLIQHGISPA